MVRRARMDSRVVILGLVAMVTLAHAASLRQPLSVEWCFSRADTYYQHPYDCTAFVRCVAGMKYEFDCPIGTRWNAANFTCDHAYLTPCNTSYLGQPTQQPPLPGVVCPPGVADGSQRDPADCNRYYRCISGVPYRLQCPAGQVFVTYSQACGDFQELSPSDQAFCTALPTTLAPAPQCPAQVEDGTQRDPTNCGRYFRCRRGVQNLEACPQDLYYNPIWGVCTPMNALSQTDRVFCSDLTTTTTTTPPPTTQAQAPECPAQVVDGTQRDPTNCGRYFRCRRGVQTAEACPQDLYFNPVWSACMPFNSLSPAERDFCSGLTTTPPPTVSTASPNVPECPAQVVDGRQRDPTNCGRYYRCRQGVISLEFCDQDLYYSTTWGTCVAFNELPQTEKDFCITLPTREPVCPSDMANGYQRDPQDCNKYVRCAAGTSYPQQCAPGLYFTTLSTIQPCDRFEQMTATDQAFCAALEAPRASSDVYCPPNVVGYQRDSANCSQYVWCVQGVAYVRRCDAGLVYVTSLQGCGAFSDLSPTDKAYCSGLEVTTPAPLVECPADLMFAQIAHPTDCGKYFRCQSGVPQEWDCSGGSYYSPQTFSCDTPERLFKSRYEQCFGSPTTPSSASIVCQGNNEGKLMDFYDKYCRRYYECKINQVTFANNAISCPPGTHFNLLQGDCTPFESLPLTFQSYCQRV